MVKGKKLLILGGSQISREIVYAAKSLGVITHVTDWYDYEDSPAKKVADEWSQYDTTNMEEMANLINKYNIDGVLTGFTDSVLPYYSEICRLNNMPAYGTTKQFKILNNKREYRELAKKYKIPTTEEYRIRTADINEGNIQYPVLIKPSDGSGARGVYICNDKEELLYKLKQSQSFSKSKDVLFERYYDCEEITSFLLIKDGEVFLTGVADRHVQKVNKTTIKLPVGYTAPSKHRDRYEKEVFPKLKKMLQDLEVKNGIIFIQSLVDDKEIRMYDLGFRLTGTLEYKIFEERFGINPMTMLINFALTGKMSELNVASKLKKPKYPFGANISYLASPGPIKEFRGIKEMLSIPSVVDVKTTYDNNDIIPQSAEGTLKQICTRAFIVAKTEKELKETIQRCNTLFDVVDKKDNSKLVGEFRI